MGLAASLIVNSRIHQCMSEGDVTQFNRCIPGLSLLVSECLAAAVPQLRFVRCRCSSFACCCIAGCPVSCDSRVKSDAERAERRCRSLRLPGPSMGGADALQFWQTEL